MPYDAHMGTQRMAVIDFETTGISPSMGDRATEVAIVLTEGGRVVDRFQSLMNAGVYMSSFITQLTGITNAMVQAAPPAEQVMADAARFVGDTPMVAHNASFDQRYWMAELARAGLAAPQPFACTVLLSRRLNPEAPSHKLGALIERYHLPQHRRRPPGPGRCRDGHRAAAPHAKHAAHTPWRGQPRPRLPHGPATHQQSGRRQTARRPGRSRSPGVPPR